MLITLGLKLRVMQDKCDPWDSSFQWKMKSHTRSLFSKK